jgi:hypothetical protein
MPIKDWVPGEQPSAADLNRYFMQQAHVIKPSTQSVTNTMVHVNDTALFLPVQANTDYWVVALIIYDAATSSDIDTGWLAPVGATMDWVSDALDAGETTATGTISRTAQIITSTPSPAGVGAGTNVVTIPKGILRVGSTAGTLQFRFAQLANSATPSRVWANSILMIRRLTS